jgi:hypothetical protein
VKRYFNICHSGACGHYCRSIEGMFNVMGCEEEITVGNCNSMTAKKLEVLSVALFKLTVPVYSSQSM